MKTTSVYSRRDLATRTWHISHATAAEIAQIADDLGVGHSQLVGYLLAFALAELRAGRLKLRTKPRAWRLLDFEAEG